MKFLFSFSLIFLLLFGPANAAELKLPDYNGYVNDFAGALDQNSIKILQDICISLEKKTSAELGIAIIKSVAPLDSKEYAVKLFEKWKIGKKGKDNGILLLVAIEERRVEIEVGYGLEGTITDATAGRILDEFVVPYFKQGKMDEGVISGAKAVAAKITGTGEQELLNEKAEQLKTEEESPMIFFYITGGIIAAFVLFFVFLFISINLALGFFGVIFGGIFGLAIAGAVGGLIGGAIGFVLFFLMSFLPGGKGGDGGGSSSSGSSSWSSGASSSSSSSSSSSFGGGSSGGGGAGRSW